MRNLTILAAFTAALALLFTACAAPVSQPGTQITPEPEIAAASTAKPTVPTAEPYQTVAPTEPVSQAVPGDDSAVLKKLNYMMPVFDSIARGISQGNEYNPADNEFFWSVLYLCAVNWGYTNPLIEYGENAVSVPRKAMQELASAMFFDYDDLTQVPQSLSSSISYDDGMDSYFLSLSDMGDMYTCLDGYFTEADGSITAKVGMYAPADGLVGTASFSLADNAYASGIADATYYYSVKAASIEAANPKLWQAFDGSEAEYTAADGMSIKINIATDEEAYFTTVDFEVNGAKQQQTLDFYLYNMACHISDPDDADSCVELYVSGDVGSDDYSTFVYRIDATGISMSELNGRAEALNSLGGVIVEAYADVLGTYSATAVYTRTSNLTFERTSDYAIIAPGSSPLTVQRDGLNVIIEHADGSIEDAVLNSGIQLTPYETDAESYCRLLLADGRRAYIDISPDTENWGWLIDGISEREWFGELPYSG